MGYLLARVVAVGVLLSARAHNFNANKSFQDESVGHSPMMNPLNVGICFLAGVLLSSGAAVAQSRAMAQTTDIVVQALDGRNGKPLANQHLLVFTGASSDAVKSHAEHTGLTTNKNGLGSLRIYPSEAQWIQVWADGRVLCQPDPNQSSFSVTTIMSKGIAAPNTCSALVRTPTPGHFVVFARPARFTEKIKQ